MNFYPRHIGDYSRDASHLSILEHGVYTLLLDRYYASEKPIPDGEEYRIVRATSKPEKAAVDAVLREFFTLTQSGWQHKRVEEEIAKMLEKSAKAASSAKRRWDANAMRTHSEGNANHKPITNNQEPIKKIRQNFVPPSVEEVRQYCLERLNQINPETFVDHYTANGWKVGKDQMKDWRCWQVWALKFRSCRSTCGRRMHTKAHLPP